MLYGINSRERDKTGFLAEKNRFAPWSGAAMQGRVDCWAEGLGELTLLRETRGRAPMGEFRALFAGTGEAVPGINGLTCGESLLGVPREVFERSAFIRQAGLGITQDAELEKRIASLIATGEEGTSYSEAREVLKRQLNRRQSNRKTGEIPAAEAERESLGQQLDLLWTRQAEAAGIREELERLRGQQADLERDLSSWNQYDGIQKRRLCLRAEEAARRARENAEVLRARLERDAVPESGAVARLQAACASLDSAQDSVQAAREAREHARSALEKAEDALQASPFAGQTAEQARAAAAAVPPLRKKPLWLPILTAAAPGLIAALVRGAVSLWLPILAACAGGAAGFLILVLQARSDARRQTEYLKRYGAETSEALRAMADAYQTLWDARESARADEAGKAAVWESLQASLRSRQESIFQEVRRFAPSVQTLPETVQALQDCAARRQALAQAESAAGEAQLRCELQFQQLPSGPPLTEEEINRQPPIRSREELSAALEAVRGTRAARQSRADQLSGQIAATGDPAELSARAGQLDAELTRLKQDYASLALAMDALDAANTALQSRFSPQLGARAAEIFSQLTAGRYGGVILNREFQLSVEPAGDAQYRDVQFLSAGAADQLYLAVRLAICELVLPEEKHVPLILDDALANFDDARCAAALQWLRREAGKRQILLFTCHSREAEFFRGDGAVAIRQLTRTS